MNIEDIARESGVSIATVSRVLNGKSVRPDSRIRVESAIEKLNFVPNAFARGLMSKRSMTIGTLITSMTNSYYMEITEVIESRFQEKGMMLFLCSTDGDISREKASLQNLVSRQVDGIIVIDPSMENYENDLFRSIARQIPLVLIHSWDEFREFDSVFIDQRRGMLQAMNYLWDLGHRRIGFVRSSSQSHSYSLKENCWREFLSSRDASPGDDLLIKLPEGNTEQAISHARDACLSVLRRPADRRPTAIFACNDLMALGVFAAAHDLGIVVPDELSIIGHDNTVLALNSYPPMSTIDLKMRNLGNAAADLLLYAMENPGRTGDEARLLSVDPELVIRDSTAKPVAFGSAARE